MAEFPSASEDDFPRTRTFPEVEFPSEFPAASAAGKAAIYRVTIHISTPDQGGLTASSDANGFLKLVRTYLG